MRFFVIAIVLLTGAISSAWTFTIGFEIQNTTEEFVSILSFCFHDG